MLRTIRTIRRSITAAMRAGRHLTTAVRGARFALLVRLYRAIDTGATVRIRYVDSAGTVSVRDISPRRLDPTQAGRITCRAYDWRDGEDTTFRADRMTILNPSQEPAMQLQTCRTHPTAGPFMATCSGCTKDLFNLEAANRKAAAENTGIVRYKTVGPYTVITRRLDNPAPGGFTYGTTVWTKATEDDALAFEMAEGAPLIADEAGAYDLAQAHRDYVDFANQYADLANAVEAA